MFSKGVLEAMATTLPKTGAVIVGVGAAGGVAALPLAQAGIDVVGLEAGGWLDTRDMAPDELRLQRGLWPPGPQKVDGEVPSSRPSATANTTRGTNHPMMNGVGGTAMHYRAQSWRLNPWDFKVVSETTRRYGASRIPGIDRRGLADRLRGSRAVTTTGSSTSSACPATPAISRAGSRRGNIFEGVRAARLPDAAAARHRLHGQDGRGGAIARLAPVPRPGRD